MNRAASKKNSKKKGVSPDELRRMIATAATSQVRTQLEQELREYETGQSRPRAKQTASSHDDKEKSFVLSFFSKRHRKTLTIPFPIAADSKREAIEEGKGRQSGDPKDNVNWRAREVRANPPQQFFCADCDDELKDKAHAMADGRTVCPKCAGRAKQLRKDKLQGKLFEDQRALFQNPGFVRNVEMGFFDRSGTFHPIRASKDYNEFLAGDFDPKPAQDKRRLEREARQMREHYGREEKRLSQKFSKRHKSLSQWLRSIGGIAPHPRDEQHTGELAALRSRGRKKGFGTSGLINKSNTLGTKRASPEYVMDAANVEGFRDAHGEKFENIGDFIAAVGEDAGGPRKFFKLEDLNEYYGNPNVKKSKAKSPKSKVRKAAKGVTSSRVSKGSKTAAKKNLFGFGKKKKPSKGAKRRTAKRTLKADRLEARARYLRSLNPAQRQAVMKAEKNPGALDTAVQLAAVLGGAETAQKLLRGKTKKGPGRRPIGARYYLFVGPDRRGNHVDTKPEAVAAARSLANATGGSVTVRKLQGTKLAVVKTVRPQVAKKNGRGQRSEVRGQKKTRNSAKAKRNAADGKIFEDFNGTPSTKVTTGYVAANSPKSLDQLAPVVQWTIADPNGKLVRIGSARDGTAQTIRGRVRKFKPNAVRLCAKETGGGHRRFVATVRKMDREAFLKQYPFANGKDYIDGPVAEVVYGPVAKPHLGVNKPSFFYHIMGEEGGRRPVAILRNGCPTLMYGDQQITAEGIRN